MTQFTPYWWEDTPRVALPVQQIENHSDVAILGAGYSGLSAAIELARAGRSVQIFEKDRIGAAASTRSGGIASGNLRISFTKMIQTLGLKQALAFHGEAVRARQDLASFVREEKINCRYQSVGRFQGAVRPAHYEFLARDIDSLNKHFSLDAHVVPRTEQLGEIGSDYFYGGAIRPDMNGVHPAMLHYEMVNLALEAGVVIHANTAVTHIETEARKFVMRSGRGVCKARDVIVATNGYTDGATPWFRRRLIPVASLMIATNPLPPELMDELFPKMRMNGNSNHLHAYFRPSPDRTRVMYGGHAPRHLVVDGKVDYSRAESEMKKVFPQLKNVGISHVWWGYVAMNMDHLPQIAIKDGIHYIGGFCGSGVVWARWFGRKAALKVLGKADGSSAFDNQSFKPVPFYNGNPWFLPAAVGWYKFRDAAGF